MTARVLRHSHPDAVLIGTSRPAVVRGSARVVQLDLSQAAEIDERVIAQINDAYDRATRAHRIFRVTPPDAPEPRAAFVLAAIRGQLRWTARSI